MLCVCFNQRMTNLFIQYFDQKKGNYLLLLMLHTETCHLCSTGSYGGEELNLIVFLHVFIFVFVLIVCLV